jgi:vacuolar-type H+-ATPase subunit E/Vma4
MAEEAIVLTGVRETLAALKKFDENAVKGFNKVVSSELRGARDEARNKVDKIQNKTTQTPMRGWRTIEPKNPSATSRGGKGWPAWDTGAIKTGIVSTRAQGKVRADYTTNAGALLNKSAAGAIFEVGGRLGGSGRFTENLNWFGKASRLIWWAVDKNKAEIEKKISDALEDAKKTLQKHLDTEKG